MIVNNRPSKSPSKLHYQFPGGYEPLLRGLPKKQLTTEEEDALAIRIQATRRKHEADEDAMNALILHSMREAFFYAMGCARNLPPDAVYSLCYAALRLAAPNFSPGRIRFFAYCKPYVRGEICKTFNELKVVRNADCQTLSPDVVNSAEEGTSGETYWASDFVRNSFIDSKVDVVEPETDAIMGREEWTLIVPILQSRLSEKERMVLELRYQSGFNFRQIGDLLKVSRSDTQATHERAINKVRCALKGKRELFGR